MERSHNSLYYSSLLSESPSIRDNTSRHANRFLNSFEASSMHLLPSNLINQSVYLTPGNETIVENRHESTFFDITNDGINREDSLMLEPCLTLYQQFFETNQKFASNDENVFEMLREYELLCCDHLTVTSNLIKSKVRHLSESVNMNKLENLLRLERNSWRLAKAMFEDRVKDSNNGDELMAVDDMITKMSDKTLIENMFERVSCLRQMQLVIDWLEHNQIDDNEEVTNDKVEFYSEGPHSWENTLHSLKTKSENYAKDRELCPHMDPDAAIRTKLPLHDLDKEDESRLFRFIFHLLRSGQLFEGKEVAQRLGYHWLSATLEGWLLHHDPNYLNDLKDSKSNRTLEPIEGNPNRDLWKSVCWRSSKIEGTNIYERAIFAVLSANIATVLPLCTRWADKLWAYFKCSLDVHIESVLRETIVVKPEAKPRYRVDLPDAYWDNKLTSNEIFREIESHGSVSSLVEEAYHQLIQKFIILGDMGGLIDHLYEWSKLINELRQQKKEEVIENQKSEPNNLEHKSNSQVVEPQLLRFFAHLVLILRHLKLSSSREELCVAILESYISYLIDCRQIELVAYYTGQLPKPNQITTFAKLLEGVEDETDRKLCIVLAKTANLDISSIAATVVDNARTKPDEQTLKLSTDLSNFTNSEDKKKINSLDWLLFSEVQQYNEALKQANSLMRTFLIMRKVDAAKDTFLKLPEDIIDNVIKQWRRRTGKSELNAEDDNAIREYLCHKAYFQANDAFSDWLYCLHNSKPKEPSKPTSTRFMDKVSYEHSLKQYEMETNHWKDMLKQQGKLAAEKIENVLLFPDGRGWMCDQREDAFPDEIRTHQLEQLRKQYIPHLVFIAHSVHHSSNNLVECLKIADIVADERKAIYKTFTRELLIDLLKKLRETSIALLNQSPDPLGYHTV